MACGGCSRRWTLRISFVSMLGLALGEPIEEASTTSRAPCVDHVQTGIRFRGGDNASCSDLAGYCNHPTLGQRVKNACFATCGFCELSTLNSQNLWCEDGLPNVAPVISLNGEVLACKALKSYCRGHNESEYVIQKCPATCLFCNIPSTTLSTTTYPYRRMTRDEFRDDPELSPSSVGCARRRRFGFCASRRRG
mmetsp:Transcript_63388/g.193886  ORF Transcript_63388/g.193886 Transcript_63388/m.193886 type:complete len:194 (-) Transcript_63388:92-673(-)